MYFNNIFGDIEKLRDINGPSVTSLACSRILFTIRCARKLFLCVAHLVPFSRVRPENSRCITIPSSTCASRTLQIYVARNDCQQWSIITETVHEKRIYNDFRFDLICYTPFCARWFYRWIALGACDLRSSESDLGVIDLDRLSSMIQRDSWQKERKRENLSRW